MRFAAALFIFAYTARAQFKSNVPLVIAPTTVTDAKGQNVDGLTADDLILYDNNVPQEIRLDWTAYPIDLVVAVATSGYAGPAIRKLGRSGILLTQLLAAYGGETAVISFSDEVRVRQDFTEDPDAVTHALQSLRREGDQAHTLDAMEQGLQMFEHRPAGRRRVIVMIAEKRDRSSKAKFPDVMENVERANAEIYWLSYSPFLEPFFEKAPEDPEPPPGGYNCILCPIHELARLHQPDLAALFTHNTGGRAVNFFKRQGLEEAIQRIGEELHRQYILSFQPKGGQADQFHALRVAVKGRPDWVAKTREGYWALP
jgi:VWFA-related protein